MSNKLTFHVFAAALTAFFLSINATAASIDKADAGDIEMLLNAASGTNSAFWATYIGEARGRVYIVYETSVHASSLFSDEMKQVVYWVPVEELSKDKLDQFKEYKEKYEGNGK